jgi:hypothetical protein
VEIGEGTVQPIVELFVSGKNLGLLGAHAFERAHRLLYNMFVARPDLVSRIAFNFACNCAPVAGIFTGFQPDLKRGDGLV